MSASAVPGRNTTLAVLAVVVRVVSLFLLSTTMTTLAMAAPPAGGRPARRSELAVRVLSAGSCPGLAGTAMARCNASLRMEGRTSVVFDIDLHLDRTAADISKLTVNQTRCREVVSQSTCQSGHQLAFTTQVCPLMNAPLMPWSTFVNSLQPPFRCPIRKGSYSGRGIAMDIRALRAVMRPSDDVGTVFVGQGTIFDQDHAPFMCIQVVTDVVRVRTHA